MFTLYFTLAGVLVTILIVAACLALDMATGTAWWQR